MQPKRAEAGAALSQRRRQTIERADAVEQGADWTIVVLQAVGTIHIETDVDAPRFQTLADRPQETQRIGGVVTTSNVVMTSKVRERAAATSRTSKRTRSLALPLTVREARELNRDVPGSGHAFDLYLGGNRLGRYPETWPQARDLYLESVRADPQDAPTWARLGRTYRMMAKYASDPEPQLLRLA